LENAGHVEAECFVGVDDFENGRAGVGDGPSRDVATVDVGVDGVLEVVDRFVGCRSGVGGAHGWLLANWHVSIDGVQQLLTVVIIY
jgi:hypothetical protein